MTNNQLNGSLQCQVMEVDASMSFWLFFSKILFVYPKRAEALINII